MRPSRCSLSVRAVCRRRGALLLECLIALVLTTVTAELLLLLAGTIRSLYDERRQLLHVHDAQGLAYASLRASPCTPPAPLTLALTPRLFLEVRPQLEGQGAVALARWAHAPAHTALATRGHTAVSSMAGWCEP